MLSPQLEEMWSSSSDSHSDDGDDDNVDDDTAHRSRVSQPVWQLAYFLLLWQSLFCVSNAAVDVLLKFLSAFVRVFGGPFSTTASETPRSTLAAQKVLWKTNQDQFVEYVVCPSCHSVYEYKDCYIIRHGQNNLKFVHM